MIATTPLPGWFKLASQVLTEAVLKNYDLASRAMQELHDTFGPEVVPSVMMAWIDTMLNRVRVPSPDKLAGFLFQDESSPTTINTVDGVPAPVAWAGRLIVARHLDDEAQARALIDSIPTDADYGRHVSALLSTVAANLRMAGYADSIRRSRGAP
jgi:hypothetical protein